LNFYMVNNEIVITDVMKNSPAEKAGFLPDDIIMAVNNNFSKNIQVYKTALQSPGEKVRILIYRNGQPLLLILKVKSII
jgi:C-terminal processing protease CtpA/Prc